MSLFGDEPEGEIKESIVYFMGLSEEERVKILTAPTDLAQKHREGLRTLWTVIMNSMAVHEKDKIVSALVDLGLDETSATILVTTLINKAPTPLYALKAVIQSAGDDFVSKYPMIINEWRINGRDDRVISNMLGLPRTLIRSVISATSSLLTDGARGMPYAVLRERMQEAGIPDNAIDTILQVLNAHYEQWRNTGLFISIQDTQFLAARIVLQNEVILDTLREILDAIRGKDPGD